MKREDIDKIVVGEMVDATRIKERANKIFNKLFPRPWWSEEKKEFCNQKQQEISDLFKEDKLPSEILTRLDEIEAEIRKVL